MQKLSNSSFLNLLSKLLLLLVVAKSISLALLWMLPDEGVTIKAENNFQPNYHRIDFSSMLQRVNKQKQIKQKIHTSGVTLTNMILKGLYGEGKHGFAILALKNSPTKTEIISVGESYSGYTLNMILKEAVIFVKDEKEYTLTMKKEKSLASSSVYITPTAAEDNVRTVSTHDIQYYAKNPDAIWKDIAIDQLPHGKGFVINRVRAGSKMAALGLQKGDIMIRANNRKLTSYKDAINLYQKIGTLQELQIVVLRNNQEKEFVYEIN